MTLSTTGYASLLPSYLKGIIEAYSTISDPVVTSGFLKSNNIEWVPHELDGGISANRMPLFSGEDVTDQTRFNRAAFERNKLEEVTMAARWYRTSSIADPTYGAVDDPRRLARILNMANPSLSDMQYLTNMVQGHARAAYWDYLENFMAQIFKDCHIKYDYDTTTGPSGDVVTFDNDVKYPAYKLVTDLTDNTVSVVDRGIAFLNEINALLAPMMKYVQGQPLFVFVDRTSFWTIRTILEAYKYYQSHRRYQDTDVGGTLMYDNANFFSAADKIFVAMPNEKFPTKVVDTETTPRCLVMSPSALKIQISQGDLTNSVGIFNTTMQSLNIGNAYDFVKESFIDQTFSKIQSYMGIEPNISSFMQNGALGGNTVPNLLKVYTNTLASGTDSFAEYPYTRAQYNVGILRANPYALRELQIKPSLVV